MNVEIEVGPDGRTAMQRRVYKPRIKAIKKVCVCVCVCQSICPGLSVSLSVCLTVCSFFCLSNSPAVCIRFYVHVFLFVWLPTVDCLYVHMSVLSFQISIPDVSKFWYSMSHLTVNSFLMSLTTRPPVDSLRRYADSSCG